MSNEAQIDNALFVLVVPQVRVQNANAISSPMTWGFPAITAFTGLMTALERRLGRDAGIAFWGVGVVCNGFEALVTSSGNTRAFHLNKPSIRSRKEINNFIKDGKPPAIIEEGRVHLDLTLIFDIRLDESQRGDAERAALAERVSHELAGMRIAGGSVMPALPGGRRRLASPKIDRVQDGWQDRASEAQRENHRQWFRRLARSWLPGFVLVSRDDLLQARLSELRVTQPQASALDAWLDLSRWNTRAVALPAKLGSDQPAKVEWVTDKRPGWTVPIPVGFVALSELHAPGTVGGARDMSTPFRFVETVWSMGQWISPHRLKCLGDVVWQPVTDFDPSSPSDQTLYRCVNAYQAPPPLAEPAELADSAHH